MLIQGGVYTDTISTLSGANITFVAPVYFTLANISTASISTFGTSYVNAIGTIANPGSVSSANASISTLGARTGTISTFTTSYVNAIGTVAVGGSISTANASISTLGCRTGTISTFTTSYINALGNAGVGGAISTTQATISSLNVSSINGASAQPKYYFVNSNATVGTVNPGSAPAYNTTFLSQVIPTVSGQKYQLIAAANINSIVGTNDTYYAQLFVNGAATTLSTAKTNSGINHNQQLFLTYQGTYGVTGAGITHALGIATSGTVTNASIPQAQFTIITPIP
jgi:hypothetical protein